MRDPALIQLDAERRVRQDREFRDRQAKADIDLDRLERLLEAYRLPQPTGDESK